MKEGWTYKKLGEVANVVHGKNQKDVLSEDGQYPIYGSGGTVMGYATNFLCEAGTTILGRKGSINNPKFIEERFWNVDTAFGITPKDDNCSKYIFYFITSIDWLSKNTGTTLPSLTQQVVKDVIIPVAPLSEQQSIVDYLDVAFAKIDAMKANAEKALGEAKALFQASLKEMMEPKDGWEEKELKEIVDTNCPISYGIVQQGNHVEGGIPVVRPVDLNRKYITVCNLKCTTQSILSAYKLTILRGDEILLSVRGTTGIVGMATEELKGSNVNRGIVPLSFKDGILRDFIYYEMLSPAMQLVFAEKTTGSTLKQINIKDLRKILFSNPTIEVQQQIVATLDSLKSKVDRLQANFDKISQECDALKQTLLKKIFE